MENSDLARAYAEARRMTGTEQALRYGLNLLTLLAIPAALVIAPMLGATAEQMAITAKQTEILASGVVPSPDTLKNILHEAGTSGSVLVQGATVLGAAAFTGASIVVQRALARRV